MSDSKVITREQFKEIVNDLWSHIFDAAFDAGYALGKLEQSHQLNLTPASPPAGTRPIDPGIYWQPSTMTTKTGD